MPKAKKITTMKSTKSTTLKKVLIFGASAAGLIIAGALVFAAAVPDEVEDEATSE